MPAAFPHCAFGRQWQHARSTCDDNTNRGTICPFQVTPCSQAAAHDWTTCPFAHAGEKAVRRDPRTHDYTGIACPDMKRVGDSRDWIRSVGK